MKQNIANIICMAGLTRNPLRTIMLLCRRLRVKPAMTVLCLFLLLAATCFAQRQEFQPEWNIGVNGGVTISEMRFVPTVPMGSLQQYESGFSFRYITEKHFGLQAELNYSMRGWTEKTDSVASFFNKYSRSLAYVEVPLLTHIYAEFGKHLRLVIHAGPQFSYFLNEKELEHEASEDSRRRPNKDGEYVSDYEYYYVKVKTKLDYGIAVGAGLELRTGIGKFVLEGRYFYGLSDTFGNVRTDGDYFEASSNQVISVKLTYFMK
jgi:hypothetical protein